MGAHIAGLAGRHLKRGTINSIIALDPAGILFSRFPSKALTFTDARNVEAIHTNTRTMGFEDPLGHSDFYINGGEIQPDCVDNEVVKASSTLFKSVLIDVCSHRAALDFYIESMNGKQFQMILCDEFDHLKTECRSSGKLRKFDPEINRRIYYVKT